MERKTPPASFGFPRQARITRGAELQRIAREGKRIRTKHLEVRIAAFPLVRPEQGSAETIDGHMRIGLIVPKHKQSGVARNRLKRRLREIVRLHLLPLGVSVDIVFRVQPDAYRATFDALAADVMQVLAKLRQWQNTAQHTPDVS